MYKHYIIDGEMFVLRGDPTEHAKATDVIAELTKARPYGLWSKSVRHGKHTFRYQDATLFYSVIRAGNIGKKAFGVGDIMTRRVKYYFCNSYLIAQQNKSVAV